MAETGHMIAPVADDAETVRDTIDDSARCTNARNRIAPVIYERVGWTSNVLRNPDGLV